MLFGVHFAPVNVQGNNCAGSLRRLGAAARTMLMISEYFPATHKSRSMFAIQPSFTVAEANSTCTANDMVRVHVVTQRWCLAFRSAIETSAIETTAGAATCCCAPPKAPEQRSGFGTLQPLNWLLPLPGCNGSIEVSMRQSTHQHHPCCQQRRPTGSYVA